jgi:FHA domain
MNAVQTVAATAIVCPNCRTDNSLQATVCLHCSEELPPTTTVSLIEAITQTDELPSTKQIADVPIATADSSSPFGKVTPKERFATQPSAKLHVIRGRRLYAEYPLYEGANLIGRRDDRPVDVDVSELEPPDRIWSSRHHAVITLWNGLITIEDLNSLNGTFVNRRRVLPNQKQTLAINDVVQIGTIQFKLTI